MKDVTLKFYGLGYNNINQADVLIYDICDNQVFEGITYNNLLTIKLCKNDFYRLIAKSLDEEINIVFYVGINNDYCFRFPRSIFENDIDKSITFLLTDYYYDNLPIERGEIILYG